MSLPQLSSTDVDFKNTITPLWSCLEAVSSKPRYNIPKTFQNCQFNTATAQTGQNTSQITFQLLNVNPTALLENCMHINSTINVVIPRGGTNNTDANANALTQGQIAPRQFPLNSAVSTCSIDLGSSNPIVTACQDFFPQALLFANDPDELHTAYSDCAGQPDVGPYGSRNFNSALVATGSSKNALGSYVNSVIGNEGRLGQVRVTGYQNTDVVANAGQSVSDAFFQFQSFEPLFSRLLTLNPLKTQCFIGCSNTSTITLVTSNFANRVISYSPGTWADIPALTATFTAAPKLYYNTYSLPPMTPIPEYSLYHMNGYQNQNRSSTPVGNSLQGQNTLELPTVVIQDTMINRAIYVWCNTELASDRPYNKSDYSGLEITKINVQYAGQQSQFSSLDNFQIYDLFHRRQGGIRPFTEFSYATDITVVAAANPATADQLRTTALGGSCLRIPCELIAGYDQSNYAVGSQISQNLQVTVSVRWNGTSATAPVGATNIICFVQCVDDSILAISSGMTQEISPSLFLTPSVIADVRKQPVFVAGEEAPIVGGSLLSDVIKGAKTAYEFSKPLVKAYQDSKKKGGNLVDQKDLRSKLLNL